MTKKNKGKASAEAPPPTSEAPVTQTPAPVQTKPDPPKEPLQKSVDLPKEVKPVQDNANKVEGATNDETSTLKKKKNRKRKPKTNTGEQPVNAGETTEGQVDGAVPAEGTLKKKRNRRKKKPTNVEGAVNEVATGEGQEQSTSEAAVAKKKRKRNKKKKAIPQDGEEQPDSKEGVEGETPASAPVKPKKNKNKVAEVASTAEAELQKLAASVENIAKQLDDKKRTEKPAETQVKVNEKVVEQKPQEKPQKERKVSEKSPKEEPKEKPAETKTQEKPQKERKVSEKSQKKDDKPSEPKPQEKQQKERKVSEKSTKEEAKDQPPVVKAPEQPPKEKTSEKSSKEEKPVEQKPEKPQKERKTSEKSQKEEKPAQQKSPKERKISEKSQKNETQKTEPKKEEKLEPVKTQQEKPQEVKVQPSADTQKTEVKTEVVKKEEPPVKAPEVVQKPQDLKPVQVEVKPVETPAENKQKSPPKQDTPKVEPAPKAEVKKEEQKPSPTKEEEKVSKPQTPQEQKKSPPKEQPQPKVETKPEQKAVVVEKPKEPEPPKAFPVKQEKPSVPVSPPVTNNQQPASQAPPKSQDVNKAVVLAPKKDVVPVPPKEIVAVPKKEIVPVPEKPKVVEAPIVQKPAEKAQPTVAKVEETKVEATKEKAVADKDLLADALKDVKPVDNTTASDKVSLSSVSTAPIAQLSELSSDAKSTSSAESKKGENNNKAKGTAEKSQQKDGAPVPKNEAGSGFAPSANDGAKSLEEQKPKEKSTTPTTAKKNKEAANQQTKKGENKTNELPEKTPQEKIEAKQTSEKLIENLDVKVTTPAQPNKKPEVPSKKPNLGGKAPPKGKPDNLQRTVSSPASSPARGAPPKVQTQKSVSPSKAGTRSSPPKTVPSAPVAAATETKPQEIKKAPAPQQQAAGSPKKTPAQNKPKIAPKPDNLKGKPAPPKGAVPKTGPPAQGKGPAPAKSGPAATPTTQTSNSRPAESQGINKLLDAFTELLKNRANSKNNSNNNNASSNNNDINQNTTSKSSPTPASPTASPKLKQKPQKTPQSDTTNGQGSTKTKEIHNILRKAFANNEKPIPKKVTSEFDLSAFLTDDQLKTILNKMENPETAADIEEVTELGGKPSQLMNSLDLLKSLASPPLHKGQVAAGSDESDDDFDLDDDDEEGEEYVEFKYAPRPIFMATICQHCKNILRTSVPCKKCLMVFYCKDEHLQADETNHKPLCVEMEKIAKTRGMHLYNFAQKLTFDDFRSLRVYTLHMCEQALGRQLQPYEREILLFPRLCSDPICREWRPELLTVCKECRHVSYCESKPSHLPDSHKKWCMFYTLYYKLLLRQKLHGRIEPILPNRILQKPTQIPDTMDEVFKMLFKNSTALKDDCTYATMTQIATVPLTALYACQIAQQIPSEVFTVHLIALRDDCTFATMTQIATIPLTALGAYQRTGKPLQEVFTMHLVGAELQFEGDTLDKFETFMLHLMPEVNELRVVFIGSELNTENLPLDIISRIRPCRKCRKDCRAVKFEFHCKTIYNEYCSASAYSKPDIICFFNPTFYHSKGSHYDKWSWTIRAAVEQKCPIVVTSYTEDESPLDLDVFLEDSKDVEYNFEVIQSPARNPYGSRKPERNFVSEEVAAMVFKNFWWFIVK